MKPQHILRQLNLSLFIMAACGVYATISSFGYVTSGSNKFFFILGGVTTVTLGFSVVLNLLNMFMMPNDKFYSNSALINYITSLILILLAVIKPNEIMIIWLLTTSFAVLNITLIISTLSFRSQYSSYIDNLRKLFPDTKSFKFDFDFKFNSSFVNVNNRFVSAVSLLTPAGPLVFSGEHFYFNSDWNDAEQFAKDLKTCGFTINHITPDEMKVIEMHAY